MTRQILNSSVKDNGLPNDCIGVTFEDERDFVCAKCVTAKDRVSESDTTILSTDGWFPGRDCNRCHRHVTVNK